MAIDALSLPYDITWQRLAWSRDMLDRSYTVSLPPKWRSSLAVYIYPVPLADTVDEYPDHRIFYLKMTASITGWSWSEEIEGHLMESRNGDLWQQEGWQEIAASASRQTYWPCVGAILQVGIYPRPEAGVADEDYPFIVDFEPKKRELYEAVTETGEVLSGSADNLQTTKGTTSTHTVDVSAGFGVNLPIIGKTGVQVGYGYEHQRTNVETTDRSTERRETMGRTTQLSQMYQLFNGYHTGTNRAVFALFPRPHTVSPGQQLEYSLIRGDRQLEGLQDVFLVVQVPRSVPGICVRGYIDTAHKGPSQYGNPAPVVVTRRNVGGCGTWEGDRLRFAAPPSGPPPRMQIVGEYNVWAPASPGAEPEVMPLVPPAPPPQPTGPGPSMKSTGRDAAVLADTLNPVLSEVQQAPGQNGGTGRRDARVALADTLNTVQSHIQKALLSNAASGTYTPVDFLSSDTFRALAADELKRSVRPLGDLERLGHITAAERLALAAQGITTIGQLFDAGQTVARSKSSAVVDAREKLLRTLHCCQPSK